VAEFFAAHPQVDVIFGDVILTSPNGRPLSYRRVILPERKHLRVAHLNTFTCATFFRRRLVDQGFLFDPEWKTAGDAAWMEKLLADKIAMAVIGRPTSVFTFTGRNLGCSSVSRTERRQWKRQALKHEPFPPPWMAVLLHRLRKMAAGAYWPRSIDIAIYTPDSPNERRRIKRRWVGFSWPAKAGVSVSDQAPRA
jgi:tRNA U34 5-methylaminomethyl-2-thiouridine-forming methyltransferase MnmC